VAKRKPYTLKDRQSVIKDALRRMEPVHEHWRVLEALYRTGAQRELTQIDISRILPFPIPGSFLRTVNMILPHLTLLINSVAARDPKFVVTPTDGDPAIVERNGGIAKSVLDYYWRRADATSILRDMTQDMVVLGNGFAKVGWAYSEKTNDRTADQIASETQSLMESATQIAQESGMSIDQNTVTEIVDSITLTEQIVEVDEPYVEYVSPYDMLLPADARRLNTARWVCQRLRLPMDEVKANSLFKSSAVENLKADTSYSDRNAMDHYEMMDQGLPEAFAYVTIYEFYDMRDRVLSVFQVDAEEALYEGEIPYAHRYSPFVHMRNYSDGGNTCWGFGDVENVAGIQLMVNEIMVAEINDLKRVGNKYFINKKVLTPELAKALAENRPDQVIPVDLPGNVAMQEVLQPVQRMATPADNYIMEGKLQTYMQQILGISDLQAGSLQSASRVPATAAAALEGATTTRSMDKMTNVEKASREIGTRILALCQQFIAEEKAIRIAGPSAPQWLQVSTNDIEGEFSIEAEGGSTQAINPASRARQGLEMLNNIVPALTNLGYDVEPALRTALQYMGLNPDHILVRPQAAAQPPVDIAGGMPGLGVPGAPVASPTGLPEASQGIPPEIMAMMASQGGQMPQGGPVSPEMNSPMMQDLASLGGSPIPAAGQGGIAL
jgi:hypothetical protein